MGGGGGGGGAPSVLLLTVACASSFSFLLGYDIGIMSGAKRLIKADFELSDGQLELLVGILNLVSGPGGGMPFPHSSSFLGLRFSHAPSASDQKKPHARQQPDTSSLATCLQYGVTGRAG